MSWSQRVVSSSPAYVVFAESGSASASVAIFLMDTQRPWPEQSLRQSRRWHLSPEKPEKHWQMPVARLHVPLLLHSAAACATYAAVGTSVHERALTPEEVLTPEEYLEQSLSGGLEDDASDGDVELVDGGLGDDASDGEVELVRVDEKLRAVDVDVGDDFPDRAPTDSPDTVIHDRAG